MLKLSRTSDSHQATRIRVQHAYIGITWASLADHGFEYLGPVYSYAYRRGFNQLIPSHPGIGSIHGYDAADSGPSLIGLRGSPLTAQN